MYRQCHLARIDASGLREQVAWIPAQFAVVNKMLRMLRLRP